MNEMDDDPLNLMEEEIELVPSSPDCDYRHSYPTVIEEEALKLAEYITASSVKLKKDIRSLRLDNELSSSYCNQGCPSSDEAVSASEDEDNVPTADLLQLSPPKRKLRRRTVVTQELQDMFGFDATPLPVKSRTLSRRTAANDNLPDMKAVPCISQAALDSTCKDDPVDLKVTIMAAKLPSLPLAKRNVHADTSSSTSQPSTTSSATKSTDNLRKGSVRGKDSGVRLPVEAAARRVTRRSAQFSQCVKETPSDAPARRSSVISKGDGGEHAALASRRRSVTPLMTVTTRSSAKAPVSKIDTGRGTRPAANARSSFAAPPTPLANRSAITRTSVNKPAALKRVAVSMVDTGRGHSKSVQNSSWQATKAPSTLSGTKVSSTPVNTKSRTLYTKKPAVVSKIDTGRATESVAPPPSTPVSSQTPCKVVSGSSRCSAVVRQPLAPLATAANIPTCRVAPLSTVPKRLQSRRQSLPHNRRTMSVIDEGSPLEAAKHPSRSQGVQPKVAVSKGTLGRRSIARVNNSENMKKPSY